MPMINPATVLGVVYDGRSGTLFLQSLLDSHPRVVSVPALHMTEFPQFWARYGATGALAHVVEFFPYMWDSRLDPSFRLGELGPQRNECIRVEPSHFLEELRALLPTPFTRRDFFLAMHWAYARCLGHDPGDDAILVYGLHYPTSKALLSFFAQDFPGAHILVMTRDPRLGYPSLFRHLVGCVDRASVCPPIVSARWHVLSGLAKDMLAGPRTLTGYFSNIKVLRLEDLHGDPELWMRRLIDWLGLEWHPTLLQSTFAGKLWWGDTSTPAKQGFSSSGPARAIPADSFWGPDLYALDGLLRDRLRAYGYPYRDLPRLLVLLAIFCPTRMEMSLLKDYLSPHRQREALAHLRRLRDTDGFVNANWMPPWLGFWVRYLRFLSCGPAMLGAMVLRWWLSIRQWMRPDSGLPLLGAPLTPAEKGAL